MGWLTYSIRGSIHDEEHGTNVQADWCWWLRVLHIDLENRKLIESHTEGSLSRRDHKANSHRDTLPSTRPYLLVVVMV